MSYLQSIVWSDHDLLCRAMATVIPGVSRKNLPRLMTRVSHHMMWFHAKAVYRSLYEVAKHASCKTNYGWNDYLFLTAPDVYDEAWRRYRNREIHRQQVHVLRQYVVREYYRRKIGKHVTMGDSNVRWYVVCTIGRWRIKITHPTHGERYISVRKSGRVGDVGQPARWQVVSDRHLDTIYHNMLQSILVVYLPLDLVRIIIHSYVGCFFTVTNIA